MREKMAGHDTETRRQDVQDILAEQALYYRERAGEYDDWWFRRGRYDHGPSANRQWFADAAQVEAALERFRPDGQTLELACGTGLWTSRLVRHASSLTAVDFSPEVLALARARAGDTGVSYVQADLFTWEPDRAYDVCFFSFWLSHVPEVRFAAFWEKVKRALTPGGRVFFVDSSRSDRTSAVDHKLPVNGDETMLRRLDDGRDYRVFKRFYEPETLRERLAELGLQADLQKTPEFFIYGHAVPLI
jgi:ubiquinone/menaquinone biosynthesis C-methylase UbiE